MLDGGVVVVKASLCQYPFIGILGLIVTEVMLEGEVSSSAFIEARSVVGCCSAYISFVSSVFFSSFLLVVP